VTAADPVAARDVARTALVTGGSRGIGRAIAEALAAAGHRVALTYSSDDAGAKDAVAGIEAAGGTAMAIRADAGDPAAVDAAFAEIEAAWDPVTILVANAGINADGLLLRMDDDQWSRVLRTNLDGTFYAVRRATKGMMKARWGRVVAVTSVVGLSGSAGQANYAAAKAGAVGFVRSVARELASRGVTANVVAPGPISTAMTDALPEERRAELAGAVPLARFGTCEEVAAVVAFLASEAAGYVTGAVVPVDGGLGMGH
jgi:3-oxoacyl-(acyl-carrier-protein) reductase